MLIPWLDTTRECACVLVFALRDHAETSYGRGWGKRGCTALLLFPHAQMWLEPLHSILCMLCNIRPCSPTNDVSCRSRPPRTNHPLAAFSLDLSSERVYDMQHAPSHEYRNHTSRYAYFHFRAFPFACLYFALFPASSYLHTVGTFTEPWFTGNTYSIKNVGNGTSRVFFSQAFERAVQADE